MARVDERDTDHLRRAIALAREAREEGNAPFGAVLVGEDGRVLAEGRNTVNTERDVTGHAETNLMRKVWRLQDADTPAASTLYASGEPCAMCAGAMIQARIARLVYGCDDPKGGAVHSCFEIFSHRALNHRVEILGGVLAEECASAMQTFFASRR